MNRVRIQYKKKDTRLQNIEHEQKKLKFPDMTSTYL